jgi:ATP-dependent protease HslVU (ClpYQ) peptidase subunit
MCLTTRRDIVLGMTTLVGIQGKDFIVFAADSQITDGDQRIISVETPKITSTGKYLLGLTGDSRPGDILAYAWKPPLYKGEDPTKFMGSKILPSISAAFKEGNYEIDNKEMNFSFLIAFNGNIFSIGGDLSFNTSERGLFAAGSGGNYALGYLYSLPPKNYNKLLTASVVAERAVQIASILDINTSPPIQVVSQERIYK